ncbi:hypothetical protein, partial [Bacillus licheniformis]|uniref:hypothetical protein n=1 Tax=Bacillus licheniformis TaxID=1402 RepID=UPI002DBDB3A3
DFLDHLDRDLKKLYLDNSEKPSDIYYLDEMDIGWFCELMNFSDGGSSHGTGNTQQKLGYIDQIPGF